MKPLSPGHAVGDGIILMSQRANATLFSSDILYTGQRAKLFAQPQILRVFCHLLPLSLRQGPPHLRGGPWTGIDCPLTVCCSRS